MPLTSFERVKTTLEHKEPDRIPFDLGGTMVTGININALRKLHAYLGLSGNIVIRDKVTQMADTGEEIINRLRVDVKNVSPLSPSTPGLAQDLGHVDDHYRLIDEFGIGWQMPVNNGHYYDLSLPRFTSFREKHHRRILWRGGRPCRNTGTIS